MVNGPNKLLRTFFTGKSRRLDHKSTAHSSLAGFELHIEINNVQVSHCAIRVVAEVVEQVANDLASKFCDQASEGWLRVEPTSQIRFGTQFEVCGVTKAAKIARKLLRQSAYTFRVGRSRWSNC